MPSYFKKTIVVTTILSLLLQTIPLPVQASALDVVTEEIQHFGRDFGDIISGMLSEFQGLANQIPNQKLDLSSPESLFCNLLFKNMNNSLACICKETKQERIECLKKTGDPCKGREPCDAFAVLINKALGRGTWPLNLKEDLSRIGIGKVKEKPRQNIPNFYKDCKMKIPGPYTGQRKDPEYYKRHILACSKLRDIQKAADRIAYAARQIKYNTDPLSTGLFLNNCRSNCRIVFGEYSYSIDLLDIAGNVLGASALVWMKKALQMAHTLDTIIKIVDLYKKYAEIMAIKNMAMGIYEVAKMAKGSIANTIMAFSKTNIQKNNLHNFTANIVKMREKQEHIAETVKTGADDLAEIQDQIKDLLMFIFPGHPRTPEDLKAENKFSYLAWEKMQKIMAMVTSEMFKVGRVHLDKCDVGNCTQSSIYIQDGFHKFDLSSSSVTTLPDGIISQGLLAPLGETGEMIYKIKDCQALTDLELPAGGTPEQECVMFRHGIVEGEKCCYYKPWYANLVNIAKTAREINNAIWKGYTSGTGEMTNCANAENEGIIKQWRCFICDGLGSKLCGNKIIDNLERGKPGDPNVLPPGKSINDITNEYNKIKNRLIPLQEKLKQIQQLKFQITGAAEVEGATVQNCYPKEEGGKCKEGQVSKDQECCKVLNKEVCRPPSDDEIKNQQCSTTSEQFENGWVLAGCNPLKECQPLSDFEPGIEEQECLAKGGKVEQGQCCFYDACDQANDRVEGDQCCHYSAKFTCCKTKTESIPISALGGETECQGMGGQVEGNDCVFYKCTPPEETSEGTMKCNGEAIHQRCCKRQYVCAPNKTKCEESSTAPSQCCDQPIHIVNGLPFELKRIEGNWTMPNVENELELPSLFSPKEVVAPPKGIPNWVPEKQDNETWQDYIFGTIKANPKNDITWKRKNGSTPYRAGWKLRKMWWEYPDVYNCEYQNLNNNWCKSKEFKPRKQEVLNLLDNEWNQYVEQKKKEWSTHNALIWKEHTRALKQDRLYALKFMIDNTLKEIENQQASGIYDIKRLYNVFMAPGSPLTKIEQPLIKLQSQNWNEIIDKGINLTDDEKFVLKTYIENIEKKAGKISIEMRKMRELFNKMPRRNFFGAGLFWEKAVEMVRAAERILDCATGDPGIISESKDACSGDPLQWLVGEVLRIVNPPKTLLSAPSNLRASVLKSGEKVGDLTCEQSPWAWDAIGTWEFKVTASDGYGETTPSNSDTCEITDKKNQCCFLSWDWKQNPKYPTAYPDHYIVYARIPPNNYWRQANEKGTGTKENPNWVPIEIKTNKAMVNGSWTYSQTPKNPPLVNNAYIQNFPKFDNRDKLIDALTTYDAISIPYLKTVLGTRDCPDKDLTKDSSKEDKRAYILDANNNTFQIPFLNNISCYEPVITPPQQPEKYDIGITAKIFKSLEILSSAQSKLQKIQELALNIAPTLDPDAWKKMNQSFGQVYNLMIELIGDTYDAPSTGRGETPILTNELIEKDAEPADGTPQEQYKEFVDNKILNKDQGLRREIKNCLDKEFINQGINQPILKSVQGLESQTKELVGKEKEILAGKNAITLNPETLLNIEDESILGQINAMLDENDISPSTKDFLRDRKTLYISVWNKINNKEDPFEVSGLEQAINSPMIPEETVFSQLLYEIKALNHKKVSLLKEARSCECAPGMEKDFTIEGSVYHLCSECKQLKPGDEYSWEQFKGAQDKNNKLCLSPEVEFTDPDLYQLHTKIMGVFGALIGLWQSYDAFKELQEVCREVEVSGKKIKEMTDLPKGVTDSVLYTQGLLQEACDAGATPFVLIKKGIAGLIKKVWGPIKERAGGVWNKFKGKLGLGNHPKPEESTPSEKAKEVKKKAEEKGNEFGALSGLGNLVKCKALPATGFNNTFGPQGGQVYPNVDAFYKQINSSYEEIRQAVIGIDVLRRDRENLDIDIMCQKLNQNQVVCEGDETFNVKRQMCCKTVGTKLKCKEPTENEVTCPNYKRYNPVKKKCCIKIDAWNDFQGQVVYPELNGIYTYAKQLRDEARNTWGWATAVSYAAKSCTCGMSFCKKPLCISGLPFAFGPLTNPYCLIVSVFRNKLGASANTLEKIVGPQTQRPPTRVKHR